MKRGYRVLLLGLGVLGGLYAFNYPYARREAQAPARLFAHRGVHHDFSREGLTNTTCTAQRIFTPTHAFIENTLPSIEAAFAYGADYVEVDPRRTADGGMVLFHDHTLDCRTEGHGPTSERDLAYLKRLDVGYGYTADGGASYPLRGRGVGAMPELHEALVRFPDGGFVLDFRGNAASVDILAETLERFPTQRLASLCVYGRVDEHRKALRERLPGLDCYLAHCSEIKRCLRDYLFYGWSGYVPASCRARDIVVPDTWTMRLMWGWPDKFLNRMQAKGTRIIVKTDNVAHAHAMNARGVYGVWTERIEVLGPALGRSRMEASAPIP